MIIRCEYSIIFTNRVLLLLLSLSRAPASQNCQVVCGRGADVPQTGRATAATGYAWQLRATSRLINARIKFLHKAIVRNNTFNTFNYESTIRQVTDEIYIQLVFRFVLRSLFLPKYYYLSHINWVLCIHFILSFCLIYHFHLITKNETRSTSSSIFSLIFFKSLFFN